MALLHEERRERIAALAYDYDARAKEEVRSCNLCGSAHRVEVARRDRYGYAATLWICARCGLGFLSPRLTKREYLDFYESVYRPLVSAYHGRRIDANTVQEEQHGYAGELVSFLAQTLSARPRSVLDIGGSTGVVAAAVRDTFGSRATVLDPAPDELAKAARAGIETITGLAEEYDPGGRRWELVLLCQTIDHLLDVAATLSGVSSMVSADGFAFVDVLDVLFVARQRGRIEDAVKIDHPYYLTRETALAYFTRAGLVPVAERLSEDGHWGFLLRPDEPGTFDALRGRTSADRLLEQLWRLRAGT